jgi:hypothetical protein
VYGCLCEYVFVLWFVSVSVVILSIVVWVVLWCVGLGFVVVVEGLLLWGRVGVVCFVDVGRIWCEF